MKNIIKQNQILKSTIAIIFILLFVLTLFSGCDFTCVNETADTCTDPNCTECVETTCTDSNCTDCYETVCTDENCTDCVETVCTDENCSDCVETVNLCTDIYCIDCVETETITLLSSVTTLDSIVLLSSTSNTCPDCDDGFNYTYSSELCSTCDGEYLTVTEESEVCLTCNGSFSSVCADCNGNGYWYNSTYNIYSVCLSCGGVPNNKATASFSLLQSWISSGTCILGSGVITCPDCEEGYITTTTETTCPDCTIGYITTTTKTVCATCNSLGVLTDDTDTEEPDEEVTYIDCPDCVNGEQTITEYSECTDCVDGYVSLSTNVDCSTCGADGIIAYSYNETCSDCDGNGSTTSVVDVECTMCDGAGSWTCSVCSGKGYVTDEWGENYGCTACGGNGERMASTQAVAGSGTITCTRCYGAGTTTGFETVSCSTCSGRGRVSLTSYYTCNACSGVGYTQTTTTSTCSTCGGDTSIESTVSVVCTTCLGLGEIVGDDTTSNNNYNCSFCGDDGVISTTILDATCSVCNGAGFWVCSVCNGLGYTTDEWGENYGCTACGGNGERMASTQAVAGSGIIYCDRCGGGGTVTQFDIVYCYYCDYWDTTTDTDTDNNTTEEVFELTFSNMFGWIGEIFELFNITLIGDITLGMLILVPFSIIILLFIFKMTRG